MRPPLLHCRSSSRTRPHPSPLHTSTAEAPPHSDSSRLLPAVRRDPADPASSAPELADPARSWSGEPPLPLLPPVLLLWTAARQEDSPEAGCLPVRRCLPRDVVLRSSCRIPVLPRRLLSTPTCLVAKNILLPVAAVVAGCLLPPAAAAGCLLSAAAAVVAGCLLPAAAALVPASVSLVGSPTTHLHSALAR